MCGLCGSLGGAEHWATRAAFGAAQTRHAERLARVRVANAVLRSFALRVDDWQGSAFVLSGATGRREIVEQLPQVWEAAARLLGRPIDPLDPNLIGRIAAWGER